MKYQIRGSEKVGLKPGKFVVGEGSSYVLFKTIESAQSFVDQNERVDARIAAWKEKNGNRKVSVEEWKEVIGWGR